MWWWSGVKNGSNIAKNKSNTIMTVLNDMYQLNEWYNLTFLIILNVLFYTEYFLWPSLYFFVLFSITVFTWAWTEHLISADELIFKGSLHQTNLLCTGFTNPDPLAHLCHWQMVEASTRFANLPKLLSQTQPGPLWNIFMMCQFPAWKIKGCRVHFWTSNRN